MNFNNEVGLGSAYQLLEEYDKAVAMFRLRGGGYDGL